MTITKSVHCLSISRHFYCAQVSKVLEQFDVEERPATSLQSRCKNVHVLHSSFVTDLNVTDQYLSLADGTKVPYSKLCLCTGGTPKKIAENNPFVLGIRDTESVVEFQKRMVGAQRVVIVGNGGIATELVYEIEGCEVIWAIKDDAISSTFIDAGAAEFLLPQLNAEKDKSKGALKRHKYTGMESIHRAVCFVFERARAPRHCLFGKGHPMRKM